jgi:hypothetical protein
VWKHLVRKEPIVYHAMFWSLVSPLGMYTLATYRLSLAADFPPLQLVRQAYRGTAALIGRGRGAAIANASCSAIGSRCGDIACGILRAGSRRTADRH